MGSGFGEEEEKEKEKRKKRKKRKKKLNEVRREKLVKQNFGQKAKLTRLCLDLIQAI